jgi:hypothetical protein
MKVRSLICICIATLAVAVFVSRPGDNAAGSPALGFIILRHVNSPKTDQYWRLCYESIRALYRDEPILIIDDSVDRSQVSPYDTHNTTVVESEYPGRGEFLPYVYYFRHKISERAIILHDSVFLTRRVPFQSSYAYQHLWNFESERFPFSPESEATMLAACGAPLLDLHREKGSWKGCFGAMTVLTHDILQRLHREHSVMSLVEHIKCRSDRMTFERVVSCLLRSLVSAAPPPVYGDIHAYCPWGITFESASSYTHLPAIKVWTSR